MTSTDPAAADSTIQQADSVEPQSETNAGSHSTGHSAHEPATGEQHADASHRAGHEKHGTAPTIPTLGKAHRPVGTQGRGEHGHGSSSNTASKIAIGEKVPDFEVTLNGKVWKLSELQKDSEITPDGTLVLTFWCSFCHSCRSVEMALDGLAKESQGKAGVIALDASFGETQEGVTAFAKKKGLTLPIALSADGSAANVFGVNSTTTTVVIDRAGKLRYFGQFGDRDHAYAKDALTAVLAGKDVPVERTRPKG